jgi:carboxymethylenebutenolidase
MRLHFGSQDPVVPLEAVEKVREAFEGRPEVEIVVHQGASHGFSHPQGPSYDETAERAAMEAVKGLLATMHPG